MFPQHRVDLTFIICPHLAFNVRLNVSIHQNVQTEKSVCSNFFYFFSLRLISSLQEFDILPNHQVALSVITQRVIHRKGESIEFDLIRSIYLLNLSQYSLDLLLNAIIWNIRDEFLF